MSYDPSQYPQQGTPQPQYPQYPSYPQQEQPQQPGYAPQYPQQPYPQQPQYSGYGAPAYAGPVAPTTSGMAIASLVCSLIGLALVGIILGYIARRQIDQSGGTKTGRGIATAGIIIGWVYIALFVLIFAFTIIISILAAASTPSSFIG